MMYVFLKAYALTLTLLSYCNAAAIGNSTSNSTISASLIRNGSELYRPLFDGYRKETPKFENATGINVNPLVNAAAALSPNPASRLLARQSSGDLPEGACAPGTPCKNGACCSKVTTFRQGEYVTCSDRCSGGLVWLCA
jgi:hypothetical protein